MASFEINGTATIDISGLEGMAAEIKSTTVRALQGEIRHLAEQILRELAHADWPAGKVSRGYVSTGELADAVQVRGNGTSLTIEMDGDRMNMIAPSPGHLGVHMGFKHEGVNKVMPLWLDKGGNNSRFHEIRGTGYFEKAFGIYEEEFIQILANALRSAGFDVSEG